MSDTNNMPPDGQEVKALHPVMAQALAPFLGALDPAVAQIDAALAKLNETIERLSALTARLSTPNYEERD